MKMYEVMKQPGVSITDMGGVATELARIGITLPEPLSRSENWLNPGGICDVIRAEQALDQHGLTLTVNGSQSLYQRLKWLVDDYFAQDCIGELPISLANHLQDALGSVYYTLNYQFEKVQGRTLVQYMVYRRVDRVKEWLVYTDRPLTDVARLAGYRSVQQLASQLSQQTGLSPQFFRQIRAHKRELQAPMD